jgi:heterodisulfide reductase subunit A-like polyferredoxin
MTYERQGRYIIPFEDVPAPREKMPEIGVDERRGNFSEVETGFTEEMAVREAKRCLSCRRCLGCALCWAECKPEAIDFTLPDQVLDLTFDAVLLTHGQHNGFDPIDPTLGYDRLADVITDLQFERMLSPTGPTGGLVMSPLDGQIPRRIAVVQAAPGGGEDHLLSSVIFAVNAAAIALAGTGQLEVFIVSPLCERFREEFLDRASAIQGLTLIDGLPESVERATTGDAPLLLTCAAGDKAKTQERLDMIVLLTKSRPATEIHALGQKLDLDTGGIA